MKLRPSHIFNFFPLSLTLGRLVHVVHTESGPVEWWVMDSRGGAWGVWAREALRAAQCSVLGVLFTAWS